jgi:hypothetical protein
VLVVVVVLAVVVVVLLWCCGAGPWCCLLVVAVAPLLCLRWSRRWSSPPKPHLKPPPWRFTHTSLLNPPPYLPPAQLSKEVQRQREYESALLRAYQALLKVLLAAADAGSKGQGGNSALQSARVAVRCMALLLTSLPHFNYGADLLQALVPRMAAGDEEIRAQACSALADLLRGDVQVGEGRDGWHVELQLLRVM